ncbi:group II intron reverse transcriptase/maturase [Endozoicomonas sp. ISHI1]|uniref:group II intron reverse transcriptase/maturase n=2 Tax=unclassified Endozoicomonas TaxID=2644528 RepID=UPI002147F647
MTGTHRFNIDKWQVVKAYQLVKANKGAAGIDRESMAEFEKDLKNNLYKIWNRMTAGSYFPPAVKAVPIPKKSGGKRLLGIPTISDRIAQMVAKLYFEPLVEPFFLRDSYGYRPGKSAIDAIRVTRKRCWHQDWVLEFDIKGLFDNISHELLMKAVSKHTRCKWLLLYVERWLKAPMINESGECIERTQGTPQGGVISPVLANLFLHYVFDKWMQKHYPHVKWCRYADDGLAHCRSEEEAQGMLSALRDRFAECGLELHPEKTKIVYCKDGSRKGQSQHTSFDFLSYTFRPRWVLNRKRQSLFLSFSPAASRGAQKAMIKKIRMLGIRKRTDLSLVEIARWINPILSGWINYYGCFYRSELYRVFRQVNKALIWWARHKYKKLQRRKTRAGRFMENIAKSHSYLFAHWRAGMRGSMV